MLAALLPGFRNGRNSILTGTVLMAVLYFWLAPRWLATGRNASLSLHNALDYLGHAGQLAALAFAALLLGEVITSASSLFLERLSRRVLTYQLRTFSTDQELADRLINRGVLSIAFASYSITSTRRVFRTLMKEPEFASLDNDERSYRFRAVMHSILFMAPRLITVEPEIYVEQQRLRADAELRDGMLLPLPLLLIMLGQQFGETHLGGALLMGGLACGAFLYLLWDGLRLWRDSNSQIAHGVCEAGLAFDHIAERERPLTELDYKSLPLWAHRFFDLGS